MTIRNRPILTAAWLLALLGAAAGPAAADDPAPRPALTPELKVLGRFVGDWTERIEFPGKQVVKGVGHTRWILRRTYIESIFRVTLPDGQIMQHLSLFTWDPQKKVYRTWMFSPGTLPMESTAAWDAASGTFSSTSKPDARGMVTISESRFINGNVIRWTVESRGKDAKVLFSLKGVDTRVPPKPDAGK